MHISIEDDARSGRPKEAISDENIKKVHKIILNGRKVNLIEIAETLKISKKRVGHIVHEYLDMLKLFAKWLPRLLTIDQNQQRVLMIRSNVWRYSTVIKMNFSVDILQWMYYGCFTTLQSPFDSQPSELNAMNRIRSVERRNGQLLLYSSITLKRARTSTASITWRYWSI
jgi:hypothetical protein